MAYPARLRSLDLPSLVYRRKGADMLQMYRIITGVDNLDRNNFVKMYTGIRTRRHKFKILRAETNEKRSTLGYRAVNDWNTLSNHVAEKLFILNSDWKRTGNLKNLITSDVITPSSDNLEKVRKTPRPTTKKQVRSFLGLVGYYSKETTSQPLPGSQHRCRDLSTAVQPQERTFKTNTME